MKDILKQTFQLREKADSYGEEVAKVIGIQPHEIPASVFAMIFNDLTIGLELLDYYYRVWGKTTHTKHSSIEEAKKENAQRVIAIQKMIFVETVSSIEFSAKAYVKQNPQKISKFKGRVYLRMIMEKLKDNDIISDSAFTLWEGTLNLRNTLVHNNGISEIDAEYGYPKCRLRLRKDKMIQGNLKMFPSLTDWLLDSLKSWILRMNTR